MRFNFARALIWPTPETSIRSFSDELWIPADGPGMGYAGDWTESGIAPGHRESTSARDSFSFSFIAILKASNARCITGPLLTRRSSRDLGTSWSTGQERRNRRSG
ncbi:hypothetical protein BDV98DRAFT_576070 [Pterulicium gracile]|uniref:Uncharacterized protein n=1 Tax=Pterulicium gracile TaxID=1884261 RepID=A0A5C3Q5K4_9AGAR|nr:hypothetical protein BDV98DRAFT_576070 [Pterula gracilis]